MSITFTSHLHLGANTVHHSEGAIQLLELVSPGGLKIINPTLDQPESALNQGYNLKEMLGSPEKKFWNELEF